MAASSSSSSSSGGVLIDTTVAVSAATFARLARSQEYYRSKRPETKSTKQEVVELGDWVPWEFQSEDQEAPSNSDSCEEVVPSPPPGIRAQTATAPSGGEEGEEGGAVAKEGESVTPPKSRSSSSATKAKAAPEGRGCSGNAGKADGVGRPQQMYRRVRLRSAVSTPLGSTHNDGLQGQTLRGGENEVMYTETDCVTGLPMFRGDMAVKTTYRVTRDEADPDNSVRVKVTVCVRDVKLARAMGWLSVLVRKSVKESARNQAMQYLKGMVEAKATLGHARIEENSSIA